MDDRSEDHEGLRGASRLGWLIGPAIVVATLLVASGFDWPQPPAESSGETPSVKPASPATS